MSNRSKQIAVGVLVTVGIISIWAAAWQAGQITRVALDLHSTPEYNRGLNEQYEDGSFIVSLGGISRTGCLPFHICSTIGADSPWEDFMPEPFANLTYFLIDRIAK